MRTDIIPPLANWPVGWGISGKAGRGRRAGGAGAWGWEAERLGGAMGRGPGSDLNRFA